MKKTITVFGGSNVTGNRAEVYLREGRELGRLIAEAGFDCLNGGGGSVMRAVSEGAFQAGGTVNLVTLPKWAPPPHNCFHDLQLEPDLRDRQEQLIVRGHGFVALAGGFGTTLEVTDIASRVAIGERSPDTPIIAVGDYGRILRGFLSELLNLGMISEDTIDMIDFVNGVDAAAVLLKKALD